MPKTIHLINPLQNTAGGSEWRTLELYRLLSPHAAVNIWASGTPAPGLLSEHPVNVIDEAAGVYPRGGVMVFVGCYYKFGDWVNHTECDRVILIYNTPTLGDLARALLTLSVLHRTIELITAAQWMLTQLDVPGVVQTSPIDIRLFSPDPSKIVSGEVFTVGRVSRDNTNKHHAPDAWLYQELVAQGCNIRIMGGTVWRKHLPGAAGIELLAECSEPVPDFIRGLDCFYYRTSENWTEPSGRVIMEAMACGVPVVAHANGGYKEWITHGENGFLFDTREQAYELIMALKRAPDLRARIGKAARASMEHMHSAGEYQKIVDYYLR